MKAENAIEVKEIKKAFKIYYDKGHTLKEKFLFRKRRKFESRKVLDGISFEVKKGEAIGLIGHNGCGKSTTLKLLTRIMYPDSGTIEMRGRVSSLIELGAGFHPDMSGRENIYTNASIFGLTRKEIDDRLEDIIAFSELGEYIDNPVRTYSSGMYMRLAFSVAINVDADILLIDEILAVGDAAFQAKCFNKLKDIKARGTTIVIVSHSLGQIEQICERSIWIQDGKIKEEGNPIEVHPLYLDFMGKKQQKIEEQEHERKLNQEKTETVGDDITEYERESNRSDDMVVNTGKRWGNGKAKIEKVSLLDENGAEQVLFLTGQPMKIRIDYSVYEKVENAIIGIGIFQRDGIRCYGTNTNIDRLGKIDLEKDGSICVEIDNLSLLQGQYWLDVAIECDEIIPVDYFREVCKFEMFSNISDVGVTRLDHRWIMNVGK